MNSSFHFRCLRLIMWCYMMCCFHIRFIFRFIFRFIINSTYYHFINYQDLPRYVIHLVPTKADAISKESVTVQMDSLARLADKVSLYSASKSKLKLIFQIQVHYSTLWKKNRIGLHYTLTRNCGYILGHNLTTIIE